MKKLELSNLEKMRLMAKVLLLFSNSSRSVTWTKESTPQDKAETTPEASKKCIKGQRQGRPAVSGTENTHTQPEQV